MPISSSSSSSLPISSSSSSPTSSSSSSLFIISSYLFISFYILISSSSFLLHSTLSITRLRSIFTDFSHHKISRDEAVNALRMDVTQKVVEGGVAADAQTAHLAFSQVTRQVFRDLVLDEGIR